MTPRVQSPVGVVEAPLGALREWDRNPRRLPDAGWSGCSTASPRSRRCSRPARLIALPDGTVIAGNMRLRAAQALGWETAPTVYVDLDENRAREWALRDNAGYGQWDDADLQVLLLEMQADGARLELTGFDEDALARLLADGAAVDLPPDIDDAPPLPAEPRSVPGEVYDLGPHRVMCGDATDRLHMPRRWPWAVAFSAALERLRAVALQI